jgi:uncharacterized membrane protein
MISMRVAHGAWPSGVRRVWVADWTARPHTALDILNRRLARGEIDRAEHDEKRKLIGR